MGLLYKDKKDTTLSVEIKQNEGKIYLMFSADCGKHGTDEMFAGYTLTIERLLTILSKADDLTDEELS